MNSRLFYLLIAAAVFLSEVAIAMGWGGPLVRGSVGDILAVVMVYFLVRSVLGSAPVISATIALSVGFIIEVLQYIHILELIGVPKGNVLYIVFGNTFSAADLVMYTLGAALSFIMDRYLLIPRIRKLQPA